MVDGGQTPSLLKIQKISWAWWRVPVIPVTQEVKAGELPEPGGGGCGEQRSHHCNPAWVTRAKLHLKKKKKERKTSECGTSEKFPVGKIFYHLLGGNSYFEKGILLST